MDFSIVDILSFLSFYNFFFDFFLSIFYLFSFFFQSSKQTQKPETNRRTDPVVKMTNFFCEKMDLWASGTGEGSGMAHLRVTPLSCFSF